RRSSSRSHGSAATRNRPWPATRDGTSRPPGTTWPDSIAISTPGPPAGPNADPGPPSPREGRHPPCRSDAGRPPRRIMKVVILAGGLGTRLTEETETRPKPMVEIGSKPILWHIMKIYAHHGFREF